ncbi:MAG: hypothetical protein Q9159_004163 [Coniocarpon cinnabarinum]
MTGAGRVAAHTVILYSNSSNGGNLAKSKWAMAEKHACLFRPRGADEMPERADRAAGDDMRLRSAADQDELSSVGEAPLRTTQRSSGTLTALSGRRAKDKDETCQR